MIDWLASYPKSGNTWMRMLLANYYNESDRPHDINATGVTDGIASSRKRFDEMLGLDSTLLTDAEVASLRPRVYQGLVALGLGRHWIKVHDAQGRLPDGEWLFPPAVSHCAVYLIRNPLDVAVSRAFHDGRETMDRAVTMLCDPAARLAKPWDTQLRQHLGDWSHHVASWVDQPAMRVLVVRYEDMLADTARELERVIRFARPEEAVDQARVALAVDHARFEKLQSAEQEQGFREAARRQQRFFRSGRQGDWVNHLSAAEVARICATHGPTMARFGYSADG